MNIIQNRKNPAITQKRIFIQNGPHSSCSGSSFGEKCPVRPKDQTAAVVMQRGIAAAAVDTDDIRLVLDSPRFQECFPMISTGHRPVSENAEPLPLPGPLQCGISQESAGRNRSPERP